jgi:hypothetical protein
MRAQRQLTYAGKKIPAGAEFDVLTDRDAAVLSTLHYAVPVKSPEVNLAVPGTVPGKEDPGPGSGEPKPKPKRRYQRRDMRAE